MTPTQPLPDFRLPVPLIHTCGDDFEYLSQTARDIADMNPDELLALMDKLRLMGVTANIYRE